MYSFSKNDKKFIDKLISKDFSFKNFINITSELCDYSYIRIAINCDEKKGDFLYEKNPNIDENQLVNLAIEKTEKLTKELLQYLLLVEFLEKEGLIYIHTASNSNNEIVFGHGACNLPSGIISIYDTNLINLIIKYAHKELIPRPSLISLRAKKYYSLNEIQLITTWVAIILSTIIGLFGLFKSSAPIDLSPVTNSIENVAKQISKERIENIKGVKSIKSIKSIK
ncbi:hypothetical protein CEP63_014595 [Proteus mirabilis]|nr:hypothetical protein CEP63_014595 [Proteus mirabilis]